MNYNEGFRDGYDEGYGHGAKEQPGGIVGLAFLMGLVLLVGFAIGWQLGRVW